MPIFRGIEISVVVGAEAQKLREFPHPDGSSVRLVSAEDVHSSDVQSPKPSDSSILSEGDPGRKKKANPRMSVYIPSVPGEQFCVRYNIIRSPTPATHIYFKMYMNGRLITSWGILADNMQDSLSKHEIGGTVARALYEPGERWYHKSGGIDCMTVGIETRYFYFTQGLDKRSVAEDGGLIEVQVFRSKARRRRAPNMSQFRSQELYGITSLSGGLVENPQDTTYFDWLLIDARDAPYATFCFHYRSMKYLLQLSLIPHSDSRPWLPKSDSIISGHQGTAIVTRTTPDEAPARMNQFAFGIESLDTAVFDDTSSINADEISEKDISENYFLKSPPILHPAASSNQPNPQQPSKALRDIGMRGIIERPLPEPPSSKSRHSSRSSLRSSCPSLTPSVAQYVNSGNFGNDEVSVGTAQAVIPSGPSMIDLPLRKCLTPDDSFSDYENSPPYAIASPSPLRSSPKTYLPTTGSAFENQIAEFTSPISESSRPRERPRIPVSASEGILFGEWAMNQVGTLSLSESEWMRRTPPSVQRKPASRLWSPRLEKRTAEFSLELNNRRGRYSDIGSSSSTDAINKDSCGDLSEQKLAQIIESEETTTGNTAYSGVTDLLINHGIPSRNTWESCREIPGRDYENGGRPHGNWI